MEVEVTWVLKDTNPSISTSHLLLPVWKAGAIHAEFSGKPWYWDETDVTVKRKGTAYVRDFATSHRRKTIRDFPIQERER